MARSVSALNFAPIPPPVHPIFGRESYAEIPCNETVLQYLRQKRVVPPGEHTTGAAPLLYQDSHSTPLPAARIPVLVPLLPWQASPFPDRTPATPTIWRTTFPRRGTAKPTWPVRPHQQRALRTRRDSDSTALQRKMSSVGEGRIFWNGLADMITSSSFFPITINVPDMLSAMGSAMGNLITQIPIINRIYLYLTQESTPRKKKKKKKPPVAAQAHPTKNPPPKRPATLRRVQNHRNRN